MFVKRQTPISFRGFKDNVGNTTYDQRPFHFSAPFKEDPP